jgi:hypothetical protein
LIAIAVTLQLRLQLPGPDTRYHGDNQGKRHHKPGQHTRTGYRRRWGSFPITGDPASLTAASFGFAAAPGLTVARRDNGGNMVEIVL